MARVALITGSSSCGIGLGIARCLSSENIITILHGLDSQKDIDEKAKRLGEETGGVVVRCECRACDAWCVCRV